MLALITRHRLARGVGCQLLEFVLDGSWDRPEDAHHVKTRQGVMIQHIYADGRHWAFGGGDRLVRFTSGDGSRSEAFVLPSGGGVLDYWSQEPTGLDGLEAILSARS